MKNEKSFFLIFTILFIFAGCNSNIAEQPVSTDTTVRQETSETASASISTAASLKPESRDEYDKLQEILESVAAPDVLKNIKDEDWWYSEETRYSNNYIMFNPEITGSLKYQMLGFHGIDLFDYRNGTFAGLGAGGESGGRPFTFDTSMVEVYETQYWASSSKNVSFLPNSVIAIVCYWQSWGEYDEDEFDGERPILFDKYCNLLPNQLRFDYGKQSRIDLSGAINRSFDEYKIIGLTYDLEKERYIAVFTKNALLFLEYGIHLEDMNDICEMGVAIFDKDGEQLERFNLPNMTYPQFGSKYSSTENPQLLLTEANELIIVPKADIYEDACYLKYNNQKVFDPVCVNLDTRSISLWTREQTEAFLSNSLVYDGAFEEDRSGWVKSWNIKEKQPPIPFEMVVEEPIDNENITLVYAQDNEKALFALPGEVTVELWAQEDDGTIHAIVSVKKAKRED